MSAPGGPLVHKKAQNCAQVGPEGLKCSQKAAKMCTSGARYIPGVRVKVADRKFRYAVRAAPVREALRRKKPAK